MTLTILSIAGTILLIYLISKMAKNNLKAIEQRENQIIYDYVQKKKDKSEYKVVLKKKNSSESIKKPSDFNDIQNTDNKYSKNVYRATNGRYKSKKQWQKKGQEQKAS